MRAEHKSHVLSEVTARVVGRILESGDPDRVGDVIGDTIYQERQRLLKAPVYRGEERDEHFWNEIGREVMDVSGPRQQEILRRIVERFAEEICGHFDPRIYALATRALPTGLALLLNSVDPRRLLRDPRRSLDLETNVIIGGESEAVRQLARKGTLIVVPTHVSNIDSLVMGYAAFLMGLPPLSYGAGLNLFTNQLIGFFMRNLGAYRVDRRKKAALYKQVLTEYATVILEKGYHSLFFPGGTRIRSGEVERHLKKGLLGTAVDAYAHNLRAGKEQPNIYVIPCTISYGLVLEAETLIEDHLKEVGKSRYIIVDDEFSRPQVVARFFAGLMKLDARIYLTFGQPLDPFGNRVDFQGRSMDRRDRPIDIARYVCRDGEVVDDLQRDHEYTNELASEVSRSFARNNRPQSTNLAAFAAMGLMRARAPESDIYRLLRAGTGPVGLGVSEVLPALDRVLERVRDLCARDRLRLDPRLEGVDAEGVLDDALRYFASFHSRPALRREGDRIHSDHAELVYYYQNRLTGYGLEEVVAA